MMTASFGRTRSLLRECAALMTSSPVRDPLADHLITPQNSAFLFIDYQPAQLGNGATIVTTALQTDPAQQQTAQGVHSKHVGCSHAYVPALALSRRPCCRLS